MTNVFIDGQEGTTGLQLRDRLMAMPDVTLLEIDPALRKDSAERKRLFDAADAVFLCLPDAAARDAAVMADGGTVVIDASTAHRTNPDWAYGFPELSARHAEAVKSSNRIAVPGCHATGFIALVYPLVERGLISRDAVLSCTSLTGYSGGGKAMIAEYESEDAPTGARPYALGLTHKHLPEMQAVCGLSQPPIFMPVLAPVKQGMLVSIPLAMEAGALHKALSEHYQAAEGITVHPVGAADALENGRIAMDTLKGTNKLEIFVFGHERQSVITARLDNLGKGASGAAVQCFGLRFGL